MPAQDAVPAEFLDLTFRSTWTADGYASLRNGEYRQPQPNSTADFVVRLLRVTSGMVGEQKTAAAILVTRAGGSGSFYDLALLVKNAGRWENTDLVRLGDRVRLKGVLIEDGLVVVDLIDHGPQDPMCCPSQARIRRFRVVGQKLVDLE